MIIFLSSLISSIMALFDSKFAKYIQVLPTMQQNWLGFKAGCQSSKTVTVFFAPPIELSFLRYGNKRHSKANLIYFGKHRTGRL